MASRTHIKTNATLLSFMDIACLAIGCVAGVLWRIPEGEWWLYFQFHTTSWVVMIGSIVLANILAGSYRVQYTYSRFNLIVTWMFSLLFAVILMTLASYLRMINPLGRGVLWRMFLVYSVLIMTLKLLFYRRVFRSPMFTCRTVILGTGRRAQEQRRLLESKNVLPRHKVVGFLKAAEEETAAEGSGKLQAAEIIECGDKEILDLVKKLRADLLVVAMDNVKDEYIYYPRLRKLRFDGVEVLLDKSASELYSGSTPLEHIDEESLMDVSFQSGLPTVGGVKRAYDVALSIIGLTIGAPVMGVIAMIVKLSDPDAPVFYTQLRLGQFGRLFHIYKFRTMRADAEDVTGAVWASIDDPRVTRFGRFLRKYRLDELPQLLNIFKGEMSLVGPRPERPEIADELGEQIPFYHERENVPPGLTGWAQVRYPYGSSVDDIKRKLEFDLYYIKNMSLSLDLQIILSTLRIVVLGMERKH